MKDHQFAALLKALSKQFRLKSIVYKNCEFGEKSLQELQNLMMSVVLPTEWRSYKEYENLQTLSITNVTIP
jgi:hypothetical protein